MSLPKRVVHPDPDTRTFARCFIKHAGQRFWLNLNGRMRSPGYVWVRDLHANPGAVPDLLLYDGADPMRSRIIGNAAPEERYPWSTSPGSQAHD